MQDARRAAREGKGASDTLLRRLVLVFAAAVAVLTLVAAAAVVLGIWPHFVQLEQREAGQQRDTALRAIQSEQDRLDDLANALGVWDEPYDYLRGANPNFPTASLHSAALEHIEVDAVLLFARDGRTVFRGVRAAAFEEVLPALAHAVISAPGLALDPEHPRQTALVRSGARAVIVSVRRVVRTDGTGESPGVIALAREITTSVLTRMSAQAGVDFALLPASDVAAGVQSVRAQAPMQDAWGGPSLLLQVLGKPELLQLGRTTIIGLALAMIVVLVALSGTFAYALVAAVIDPVRALRRRVSAMSRGEAPSTPKRSPPAEIAELADAFEAAFANSQREATRHKAAREEALAARAVAEKNAEAKSRFLATMSHELRTPLNAVIGYTEILQEEAQAAGRVDQSADFDRVLAAAHALLNLINSILDFARLETGRMPLFAEEFSVADLARGAADIVRPLMTAKGLNFTVEVAADVGLAVSDPVRISQCLVNVLANAAKFTAAGDVCFRVGRRRDGEGDWLLFAVEDTGIGMSPEQLQRVFEPFMQGDEAIARRYGGAGLGLTITSELLSRLGGKIGIRTELGLGARVVLKIPACLHGASQPIALASAA